MDVISPQSKTIPVLVTVSKNKFYLNLKNIKINLILMNNFYGYYTIIWAKNRILMLTIILFLNDKILSFINKFILSTKYNIIA